MKMLLDMSRLEAGKFELTTEPIASPITLVEPCLKMVDAMAREKSVRLMTDIPRSLPMLIGRRAAVPADPHQPAVQRQSSSATSTPW